MLACSDDIETLFLEVHDLPLKQRQQKLLELCPANPEVVNKVELLVLASEQAPHFLSHSPFMQHIDAGEAAVPERLGPYAIRRLIGQGGMGNVYLAERVDGEFDQLVAIKIIKKSFLNQASEKQFIKERQILANLHDSHIARLLDGGRTTDNRPYFVMEYIQGISITDYVKNNKLDVLQIIELFIKTCRAIQVAHENGIVHRDLKPNNIMINTQGSPKLLDFGIAKIMHEDQAKPGFTCTGKLLMTPEYAAPEMIEGKEISTATDIYALGVIFYELITGKRPYELTNLSLGDLVKTICEAPILPPSKVSQNHKVDKSLDVIILKALQKSVDNRYHSAGELINDLQNFLNKKVFRSSDSYNNSLLVETSAQKTKYILGLLLFILIPINIGFLITSFQSANNPDKTNSIRTTTASQNAASNVSYQTETLVGSSPDGRARQLNYLSQLENEFALKLVLSDDASELQGCNEIPLTHEKAAMEPVELINYKCNILQAQWYNAMQAPDSAMNALFEARLYFSQNKHRINPLIKASMFQVLSETRYLLNEKKQALLYQKKAVNFFRFASNIDASYRVNLSDALEILSFRYSSMGQHRLARKAYNEVMQPHKKIN